MRPPPSRSTSPSASSTTASASATSSTRSLPRATSPSSTSSPSSGSPATSMRGGIRHDNPTATNISITARRLFEVNLAETPLTLQSPGLYLSIHEAALVDYASMNLRRTAERTLKADLMPWSDGVLVRKRGPFITPWRTVLIGDYAHGAGRLAHRAQSQRAEPPRRHLVDPHRQVRRRLVGDASQPLDLGRAARSTAPTTRTSSATSISRRRTASAACWSKAGIAAGTATGSPTASTSASPSPIRISICRSSRRMRASAACA